MFQRANDKIILLACPLQRHQRVLRPIIDHGVGAQAFAQLYVRAGARGSDLTPQRLRDLDPKRPRAATAAVDEHLPPFLHVGSEALVRGQAHDTDTRGVLERYVVGERYAAFLVHDEVLGQGAEGGRLRLSEDELAGLEVGEGAVDHDAGVVEARDCGLREDEGQSFREFVVDGVRGCVGYFD